MKKLNFILAAGIALGLAACAGTQTSHEVERLNNISAQGSAFTQALTAEYRSIANNEYYDEKDYPDGIHFARKGWEAANGIEVMPEQVEDWNLSQAQFLESSEARAMLVTVLENGARNIAPQKSAMAQGRFDCWTETQEEDWSLTNLTCKREFYALLRELQGLVVPAPVVEPAPAPIAPIAAPAPVPVEEALFIVFFDWDKSNLTSGSRDVVDAVVGEVSKHNDISRIILTGHADSSGKRSYNERLSLKRADMVKTALIQRGISPNMIVVQARGENELLVSTADDVREPANRRVQITLE